MGIPTTGAGSAVEWSDNQGAIALAKNPVDHRRTRLVNVSYHFVRELVTNGTIQLKYVAANDMVADGLTI